MISRYQVSLGGSDMAELDENLYIHDISYSPVEKQYRQNITADLDGVDIAETRYNQRTVTISFELHIYGVAERNAACQKVNNWAKNGGILRTNDREGQYLTVICQQLAEISSAKNWTDTLTLVFVSTYSPFWQSDEQKTLTLSGKSASGALTVDGNIGSALVSCTVTARAAVSSFQITAGSNVLKLTGLSLAANKQLVIDYVRGRYLRIRADGKSVLAKLDPASADNLKAVCGGSTNISVTANNSVTAVITARGCWL